MRKTLKKIAATLAACTMAFAVAASVVPNTAEAVEPSKAGKKAAKAEFDPDGTYHAYFGMQQTGSWIFRDEWYSETLGTEGKDLKKSDLPYEGAVYQSGQDGLVKMDGTVTDVEITGNGTYTVGVEGLNGCLTTTTGDDVKLAMLYVSTDIPMTAKDSPVTISDWKLTMDGSETSLPSDVFFPAEYTDESGLIRFDAVNTYQTDKGIYADGPTVMPPSDSIKITFTVSGFNSDNPDAVEQAEDPAAGSEAGGSDDASTGNQASSSESSGGSATMPIVIVVIVVIVIAVVAVVVVKKKKE